jgi:sorting nexin-4
MAVMDQDNFSNISWHSEQEAGAAASNTAASSHDVGSPEYPGSGARAGGRTVEGEDANLEPAHGGEILECVVSSPNKENDGSKDAYVSYLITTHVCSPSTLFMVKVLTTCPSPCLAVNFPHIPASDDDCAPTLHGFCLPL